MSQAEEWAVQLIEKCKVLGLDFAELFRGGATVDELLQALKTLVAAAELVFDAPGTGAQKKEAVMAVLTVLKRDYRLVEVLDSLLPLPWPLELFDGQAIDMALSAIVEIVVKLMKWT